MVDGRFEQHHWRGVRISRRKREGELEDQSGVGRVYGTRDGSSPSEQVVRVVGKGRYTGSGGKHQLHEFGLQAGSVSGLYSERMAVIERVLYRLVTLWVSCRRVVVTESLEVSCMVGPPGAEFWVSSTLYSIFCRRRRAWRRRVFGDRGEET